MMASELNAGSRTSGIQANRNDLADENVGLEGKVNRLPRIASSGFLLSDSGSPIPNSPNPTRWGLLSPMSDAHTDGDSTSTSRTASCVSGSSASPFAPVTKEILESRITNEIKEMRAAGLSSVDFETNAGNISNLLRSLLLYNEKYEANSKTEEMKEVIEEMKEGKKLFFAAKALLSNKSATVDQLDECALELKTYVRREKFLSLADKKLLRGERNKCVDLAVKVRFESMLLGV